MARKHRPPSARRGAPSSIGLGSSTVMVGGIVAILAMLLATFAHTAWLRTAEVRTAELAILSSSSARMASPSPDEGLVADSCEVVRPLWGDRTPADFFASIMDAAPLLSTPGAEWSSRLFSLAAATKVVTMWPFRIQRDHGTAVLQTPASGFVADFSTWKHGDLLPDEIVEIAMREQRTLVYHNLEVYWPPIAALTRHVSRCLHMYTQVNMYLSPPGLRVATAPHQDAHSVFIIQIHGAKRWAVHAPRSPLTLKGLQRGKRGEVLEAGDAALMGPALINATLRPGQVLHVPRAYFHHTATDAALLQADTAGEEDATEEPSLALTVSMLNEDVYGCWIHLLGGALEATATALAAESAAAAAEAATALVRELRRRAVGADSLGVRLREGLPRALTSPLTAGIAAFNASSDPSQGWRDHVYSMLREASGGGFASGEMRSARWQWLEGGSAGSALLDDQLDIVLEQKRIMCRLKIQQLDTFLREMAGKSYTPFSRVCLSPVLVIPFITANDFFRTSPAGRKLGVERPEVAGVDIDAIFRIEKRDRSYLPKERVWRVANEWHQ